MNLIQAFRFSKNDCISFIGSGGKTTAMFQIARQYSCSVLVTTTTHIGAWETELADQHIILDDSNKVKVANLKDYKGVTVLTGPRTPDDRFRSPTLAELDDIYRYAQNEEIPLLIEADGSRRKPLKAPGDNEPVIPSFSTCVVNVVGLTGIGKPCGKEWVFRPEKFAEISGTIVGEKITSDSVVRVLTSKFGGLKNIKGEMNRFLILNHADNIQLQALAGRMADALLPFYEKIGISKLITEQQLIARKKTIAGIILAAGGASRFGKAKQLNTWREKTYTENVVIAAQQAGLSPIIVVTGYQHEVLENILKMYPAQVVHNPDWQQGQSTSMKTGLKFLEKHTQGAIFLMADQPQVSIRLIRALMEQAYLTDRQVIGPMIDGKRSTPKYFDRSVFPELMAVSGDQGGRSILSPSPPFFVEWFDTRMRLDIDFDVDVAQLTKME
jgi:molybdenum cofactor cytidylyltransferase